MLTLDHLAVLGTSLAAAQAHAEAALGRVLRPGGRHPHFATHNALLGLEAGLYLEAIAIDPDAKAPGYPRWFGLDDFTGAPRFDKWICRVDDLDAALQALPVAGQPVALSRGDLRWRMAVPGDGRLPWVGLFPALNAAGSVDAQLSVLMPELERRIVGYRNINHPIVALPKRTIRASKISANRIVKSTGIRFVRDHPNDAA